MWWAKLSIIQLRYWHVGGERLWWWLHPLCMTQSSIALLPWLPSFPPQAFPTTISSLTSSIHVCPVNSSPRPWIAPQSPNSSSQPLCLPGEPASLSLSLSLCVVSVRTVWFLFHLACHRSAVSLSAFNVSPLTQTVPTVRIRPLIQFPHLPSAGPILLTLPFPP